MKNTENYSQEKSKILNIFNISRSECEKNLLLGYHSLIILNNIKEVKLSDIFKELLNFGYNTNDIENTFKILYKSHFYYYICEVKKIIQINELKVRGYISIFSEPAYIDNVAIETPIPQGYLSKIKITNGYEESNFQKRVESTLEFLSYLRQREEVFSQRHTFNSSYNAKYAWILLGNQYLDRLKYLKRNHKVSISNEWWNEIMSRGLIKAIENDFPTKNFYPIK